MSTIEKIFMALGDENLWDNMTTQYQYVFTQFGIGIVGVGALFFAYGTATSYLLRELIAMIGFASSYILWMHTFAASMEVKSIRYYLKKSDPEFWRRYELISSWRHRGLVGYLYHPVTRMVIYFMGLLTLAWLSIILFLIGFPLTLLIYFNIFALCLASGLAVFRRYQELKNFKSVSKD